MRTNALSVANYFIDLAHKDNKEIKPLKLMKLIYIAYGYSLALLDKSILDPRFDKVEAWKLGPVIPSVYHSFKIYGKSPIGQKTTILTETSNDVEVKEPKLEDREIQMICEFVWKKYGKYNDSYLVTLLHGVGTPWGRVYSQGQNNPIPENLTKLYYKHLVRVMEESNGRKR